jgi:hypothetical protein
MAVNFAKNPQNRLKHAIGFVTIDDGQWHFVTNEIKNQGRSVHGSFAGVSRSEAKHGILIDMPARGIGHLDIANNSKPGTVK